MSEIALG